MVSEWGLKLSLGACISVIKTKTNMYSYDLASVNTIYNVIPVQDNKTKQWDERRYACF